jgi:hypothetical protein
MAKCVQMDWEIPTWSDKREGRGKSRTPIYIHYWQQRWGRPCHDSGKPIPCFSQLSPTTLVSTKRSWAKPRNIPVSTAVSLHRSEHVTSQVLTACSLALTLHLFTIAQLCWYCSLATFHLYIFS